MKFTFSTKTTKQELVSCNIYGILLSKIFIYKLNLEIEN